MNYNSNSPYKAIVRLGMRPLDTCVKLMVFEIDDSFSKLISVRNISAPKEDEAPIAILLSGFLAAQKSLMARAAAMQGSSISVSPADDGAICATIGGQLNSILS